MNPLSWSSLIGIIGGLAAATEPQPNIRNAAALLSRMEARAVHLRDYTVSGEGEAYGKPARFKLYFKQPNLVRLDTSQGQVTVQPKGEIRGRLRHGLFGRFSRRLKRDDHRLRDADGCPFWDSCYAAALTQIQSLMRTGAGATVSVTPDGFDLTVRYVQTVWRYVIDPQTLFFRDTSRSAGGRQVEKTRYCDFRCNVGLEPGGLRVLNDPAATVFGADGNHAWFARGVKCPCSGTRAASAAAA